MIDTNLYRLVKLDTDLHHVSHFLVTCMLENHPENKSFSYVFKNL